VGTGGYVGTGAFARPAKRSEASATTTPANRVPLRHRHPAGQTSHRISITRRSNDSRLIRTKRSPAITVAIGRRRETKAARWRSSTLRKRKHKPVPLPACEATIDQHGLMFIGLTAPKPIQTGKRAREAHRRIRAGVSDLRGNNSSHRSQHHRVAARRLSRGLRPWDQRAVRL
jgi:hypothetical protein